jgi:hypothetical protein
VGFSGALIPAIHIRRIISDLRFQNIRRAAFLLLISSLLSAYPVSLAPLTPLLSSVDLSCACANFKSQAATLPC